MDLLKLDIPHLMVVVLFIFAVGITIEGCDREKTKRMQIELEILKTKQAQEGK